MSARCVALLVFALSGCTASSAQLDRSHGFGGTRVSVAVEQVPVRGHQIDVEAFGRDARRYNVSGELLAVDPANIWVLEPANVVTGVPRDDLLDVKIELYDSGSDVSVVWTVIGAASTLSHGVLLIVTGPVWIVTGTAASFGASQANNLYVPPEQAGDLYQFARFPQGLPPGFLRPPAEHRPEWLSSTPR